MAFTKEEIEFVITRTKEIELILTAHDIPITKETMNTYVLGSQHGMQEAITEFEKGV
jgi:hypothetical protein